MSVKTLALQVFLLTSFLLLPITISREESEFQANSIENTKNVTVRIGYIDFDCSDTSLYQTLELFSIGNGTTTLQSARAKSGKALNLSSDSLGKAYMRWGLIKKTPIEEMPLWAITGLHFKFDIFVCTPPSAFAVKWLFHPLKKSPQCFLEGTKMILKNSSGSSVSTQAFSYNTWHWIDISFCPVNNTIKLYWDSYDITRLEIQETDLRTVRSFQFGDDWEDGAYGQVIIDNLQFLGNAKIANTGKPVYYSEIIALKKEAINDPIKLIEQANKTDKMRFTFLLENGTRYLHNKTVTDKLKQFLSWHPESIVGLWIDYSPSKHSVQSILSSFNQIFGYYPKAAGAYTISQTVINTAKASPYNITAFLSCTADANGYSQFWNYPFFISDKAKLVPSEIATSGVIGFQWATSHPLWYSMDRTNFLAQGDFSHGGYSSCQYKQFQYFIYEANNTQYNDFGFINNGIETNVYWQNATLGRYVFNWTLLEWDRLMSEYPGVIQARNLYDMANMMLSYYSETPLYLLYYPNWETVKTRIDSWIIESSAFRSILYWNSTYFGIISLQIYGNTTMYQYDNGDLFNFPNPSTYSEIMRSTEYPFHGITIQNFSPTAITVRLIKGIDITFAKVIAQGENLEWTVQFFCGEISYISLGIKALSAQSPELNFQITESREEVKPNWKQMYKWGSLLQVDGVIYTWENLSVSLGNDVSIGFNHSTFEIRNYPNQACTIEKIGVGATRSFLVSYNYSLQAGEERLITLIFGYDVRERITHNYPLLLLTKNNPIIKLWHYSRNKLIVSAVPSGEDKCMFLVYVGDLGNVTGVLGETNFSFNSTSKILTLIQADETEELTITLLWQSDKMLLFYLIGGVLVALAMLSIIAAFVLRRKRTK